MERGTARIESKTAAVALVSAVITLVVSVTATVVPLLNTLADRDGVIAERDAKIDKLDEQLTAAQASLSSRQKKLDDLKDENIKLRASLPYEVSPEEVPNVRATATVVLAKDGDTLDLNSTRPNFNAGANSVYSDSMSYDGKVIQLAYGTSVLALKEGVAKYETCAAATGYAEVSQLEPHLLKQPITCIRLRSGHYAVVQVSDFDENTAKTVVTVWE